MDANTTTTARRLRIDTTRTASVCTTTHIFGGVRFGCATDLANGNFCRYRVRYFLPRADVVRCFAGGGA